LKGLLVVSALIVVAMVYASLDPGSGIRTSLRLHADLRDAQARIAVLRGEIASLDRDAEVLKQDDFALERAIREQLLLARPGETVVRTGGASSSNPRIP
jgi:cell division protein FtsB